MISLKNKNDNVQLLVSGKPFLVLGGELANSSASSAAYMDRIWPDAVAKNLNTLLVPVYWELLEPEEGSFDFTLIDYLLENARIHGLKLILLWFGTWKNSMSCYVPSWVKKDTGRFPRVHTRNGNPLEILSAFSANNLSADTNAFRSLMRHVRDRDSGHDTVIMAQVENEVAMMTEARDFCFEAEAAYEVPVPVELFSYLEENRSNLHPALLRLWEENGAKTKGNWPSVFGASVHAEEVFAAWHLASYVSSVASEGKKELAIPMYTNAALNRPGLLPGQYPAGGPLPHLLDVWRAAAPALDFFAPDIYLPDFALWCGKYDIPGNPLFIPEAYAVSEAGARAFFAIGGHRALGFSPFSIDTVTDPAYTHIAKAFAILSSMTQVIADARAAGNMTGVLLDTDHPRQSLTLGAYVLHVAHDHTFEWSAHKNESVLPATGCLIVRMAEDEYLVAGTGVIVTFAPSSGAGFAGIVSIDEGAFHGEEWVPGRRLNGDENHQGRHLRIEFERYSLQRVKLYMYD